MLLLGVEKVRTGARDSFANTISGTDLIVGARSRRRAAPALLGVPHRQRHRQRHLAELPGHRGAARGRLDRAALARRQPSRLSRARHRHRLFRPLSLPPRTSGLAFTAGRPFEDLFDAVHRSGRRRAARLQGRATRSSSRTASATCPSPTTTTSRSVSRASSARTGTPVDRTVHVSLEAIEAIHVDWQGGARHAGQASRPRRCAAWSSGRRRSPRP